MTMDDLDFEAESFRMMSPAEQAELCLKLATKAQRQADSVPDARKREFLDIAKQWLLLAEAMASKLN